ncbi:MAG TPA: DinB family protein [Gemmatimonadales bacterium]|nr:DinB family protein [Gemmatimonadales bacterium]
MASFLDWHNAHVTFDQAVAGVPENLRGTRPEGFPHSVWELVEHLRICQWDILDYCVNPQYREGHWPDDYWPTSPAPPTPDAWDRSQADFKRDLATLKGMALDPKLDLLAPLPYAPAATYLRELLLVADHNAYHVGQIVAVRRLLGIWKS